MNNYNSKEKRLINYTKNKVKNFLATAKTPAHGLDHAIRVARYARQIAAAEHANQFLSELGGLLHDVGYVKHIFGGKIPHQEFSYQICREWFRRDKEFSGLTLKEKEIILYSIRFHCNDSANKFPVAWIVRDADKLDRLGTIGVKRSAAYCAHIGFDHEIDLRLAFHMAHNLRTAFAKNLLEKNKLLEPTIRTLERFNQKRLKLIKL